ncbi:MAG: hypothetical protein QMC90_05650 [Dehalococcoidales bacterium]|nr:hypothetical protein [Dehalococcoidales bacterium]
MENKIGITTTVPIEILIAAGYKPVDLNNVFITHPSLGQNPLKSLPPLLLKKGD